MMPRIVLSLCLVAGACHAAAEATPDATTAFDASAPATDAAAPPSPSLETEGAGGLVSLRNAPPACDTDPFTWGVRGSTGEVGWFASRIMPVHAPFAVESIHHQLYVEEAQCGQPTPYRMRVLRAQGAMPPAAPTAIYETTITPPSVASGDTLEPIDTVLPTPIELAEGDSLFVMFELIQQGSAYNCYKACKDASIPFDHDWEGPEVDPPITWVTLGSPTDLEDLDVRVDGHRM